MEPLKVYLDTQDYINLYENRSAEHELVYKFLCEKVDSGEIVIGYSYFIIAEFLSNYTEEFKENRLARVAFIKRLCRRNSFIFINRIPSENSILDTNGDWTPKVSSWFFMKKGINEGIKKLQSVFPGKIKNDRSIKHPLKNLIRSRKDIYQSTFPAETFDIPVPLIFRNTNIIMRYLCGEVPEATMEKYSSEVLTDLNLFFELWFEYGKKGNQLLEIIRAAGKPYISMLEQMKYLISSAEEKIVFLKGLESKITRNDPLKKVYEENLQILKLAKALDLNYFKSLTTDKYILDRTPPHLLELVISYYRSIINSGRKVQDSDSTDILHAVYLPYCDVWRGDKSFSHILISEKVIGYENIVPQLELLPKAIIEKLNRNTK